MKIYSIWWRFWYVVFNSVLNIDLNCINLDDNNFDEGDPDTIIHVRFLAWNTKFEKRKTLKKELNEELMPVAWHPNGCWDWCISEDEKKNRSNVFWRVIECASVVYKVVVLKHFAEECVGSIRLGSIKTFWRIRTFLIKICAWRISLIEKRFLNFLVWFFNEKCPKTPKCPDTPQLLVKLSSVKFSKTISCHSFLNQQVSQAFVNWPITLGQW